MPSFTRHTLCVALLAGACGTVDVGPPLADVNACRPSQTYFAEQIWPNYLDKDYGGKRCSQSGCHDTGAGRQLVLTAPPTPLSVPLPSDWAAIYRSVTQQMLCTDVGSSPLIARPDGRQSHAVKLIQVDGPESTLVKMWVAAP
jgi:hypothetical protein